jgi:hypothetical protein
LIIKILANQAERLGSNPSISARGKFTSVEIRNVAIYP